MTPFIIKERDGVPFAIKLTGLDEIKPLLDIGAASAEQAEAAELRAKAWAESSGEPIPGSKSAKTWAEEAADDAAQVSALADELFDTGPTSFTFAASISAEMVAQQNAGKYIARHGSNANPGTSAAPLQTYAYAKTVQPQGAAKLMLKAPDQFLILKADANIGNEGAVLSRSLWSYGEAANPPMLHGRNPLAGKTWTVHSGEVYTTTVTAQEVWSNAGIEVSDGFKPVIMLDDNSDDGGLRYSWVTGGASANANVAALTRGSFAISIDGSTLGDIRNETVPGVPPLLRIHLRMHDGGNPNGKAHWLNDRENVVTFYGGEHGHLRVLGGAGKDSVTIQQLFGKTATFSSLEVLFAPGHGCVGVSTQIAGTFHAILTPTVGESTFALGRTLGAGYVAFTGALVTDPQYCGRFVLENGGLLMHGAGDHQGYLDFNVYRRSRFSNAGAGVAISPTGTPGLPFVRDGVRFLGGLDLVDVDIGYQLADDTVVISGGSWTPPATASQAILADLTGAATVHLLDYVADASLATGIRSLLWFHPYSNHVALGLYPNLILENYEDRTTIDADAGLFKLGVTELVTEDPEDALGGIDMRGKCLMGNIWGADTLANIFPRWITADAVGEKRFGAGNMKRKDFEAAMTALGRTCTGMINVTFVDNEDNVISPAGVVDPEPIVGANLIVGAGEATGSWTGGDDGDNLTHGAGNFEYIRWAIPTTEQEYRVSFEITAYTSGTFRVELGAGGIVIEANAIGPYTVDFERPAGGDGFAFAYSWPGFVGTVTDFEVRPLTYP